MYTVQVRDLEVLNGLLYYKFLELLFFSVSILTEQSFISQEMKGEFQFCVEKPGVFHGFTAWFTVQFESLETGGATVELNTGPNSE